MSNRSGELYDRTRDAGFGAEVKRRIMLGTYVLSAGYYDAYYLKALQVRTLIRRDFERAFAEVDAVAVPTTPTAAFRLGEHTDDPLQMYLADIFTVSAPLAGLPAVSVPCGLTPEGLPAGLQLTGRAWDEATLLAAGGCVRANIPTGAPERRPLRPTLPTGSGARPGPSVCRTSEAGQPALRDDRPAGRAAQ